MDAAPPRAVRRANHRRQVIESTSSRHRDIAATHKFDVIEGDVTSAISTSHGLGVADLVVVEHGSILFSRCCRC